ncbi:TetR-like C-terminal domain-containing protein [Frankia sp. Cas4]|uniref:TetR-like C-terminal domain-containing protein n=1 Tax=Frankia sp. Cas4 TaxID=3073927 RepID=UPI002AD328D4|nr:TetR-like C-terminal domain-containing protein [Frankia sp. Cas4]
MSSDRWAPATSSGDGRSAPRSRRRGDALDQAILDAAWDELAAVGSTALTVAAVAARAGTSKAVLYRRWPTRTDLLAAAVSRRVVDLARPPVDTGTLRTDVIAVLTTMNQRAHAAQAVPDIDDELATHLRRQAHTAGADQMNLVLERARRRGEIDPDNIPARLARLPVDLLHTELSLQPSPAPYDLIVEIVDELFLPLAFLRASPRPAHDNTPCS